MADLNHLLDDVVHDVEAEDELARHDEVVEDGDVSQQFHGPERPGGYETTRGRELKDKPSIKRN